MFQERGGFLVASGKRPQNQVKQKNGKPILNQVPFSKDQWLPQPDIVEFVIWTQVRN